MKKALVLLTTILLILQLGCADKKQNNNAITNQRKITDKTNAPWQETPIFLISGNGNVYRMRGIKGRLAFVESPLIKGNSKEYQWYFWGNKDELVGKRLKIKAMNKESGTKLDVVTIDKLGTEDRKATPGIKALTEKNATNAAVYQPLNMSLPSEGLWRLEIYLDDKIFGYIVVNVYHEERNLAPQDNGVRPLK